MMETQSAARHVIRWPTAPWTLVTPVREHSRLLRCQLDFSHGPVDRTASTTLDSGHTTDPSRQEPSLSM